jgi:hypothetical protein
MKRGGITTFFCVYTGVGSIQHGLGETVSGSSALSQEAMTAFHLAKSMTKPCFPRVSAPRSRLALRPCVRCASIYSSTMQHLVPLFARINSGIDTNCVLVKPLAIPHTSMGTGQSWMVTPGKYLSKNSRSIIISIQPESKQIMAIGCSI